MGKIESILNKQFKNALLLDSESIKKVIGGAATASSSYKVNQEAFDNNFRYSRRASISTGGDGVEPP